MVMLAFLSGPLKLWDCECLFRYEIRIAVLLLERSGNFDCYYFVSLLHSNFSTLFGLKELSVWPNALVLVFVLLSGLLLKMMELNLFLLLLHVHCNI